MANPWLLAARPKTLPAAIIPVLLGTALAWHAHQFDPLAASLALLFALLVQVGTNYANDYYDFVKGADTADRIGPTRATAAGLVKPEEMRRAMWLVFGLTFLVGCGLIPFGGWWLLVVGVASIACGWAYTGGPYPLGYNGLGDVFVFFFFGFVATMLTFYVQAQSWIGYNWAQDAAVLYIGPAFWISIVPGALATNILVVNNLRDVGTDAMTGKRTLAVRFGRDFGVRQYQVLVILAAIVPLFLILDYQFGLWTLLPWLSLPLGLKLALTMGQAAEREGWLKRLAQSALFMLLYGVLLAAGLIIDTQAH
ncbi:MAG: 1,4-dihydroxy-2-naphthoate polyprenyltransferase [Verrucomicrobiota bacterium JB022]|nr:1,4-dihydroxy-2-naphthoate polyprenyltransferase [Verrucomicrobiota bacterium JB022]